MGSKLADWQEPKYSYVANAILQAFTVINKSRRFVGQLCTPNPIDISDIEVYARNFAIPCDFEIFCDELFAVDYLYIEQARKEIEQAVKRKPS